MAGVITTNTRVVSSKNCVDTPIIDTYYFTLWLLRC
jgi:hypothetical protein